MHNFPLEYALVEFEGNKFSGKIVPELLDLAERGIVRFVDIVFVQKDKDGSTRTVELNDLDAETYKMFVPLGEHINSLFSEEDLNYAAGRLPNNSSAALFLWVSLWAEIIRKAIVASGGVLAERDQISFEMVEQARQGLAAEK